MSKSKKQKTPETTVTHVSIQENGDSEHTVVGASVKTSGETKAPEAPAYRHVTNALQRLFDAHNDNAVLNGVFNEYGVNSPQEIPSNRYAEVIDKCAALGKVDNKSLLGSSKQPAQFELVNGTTLSLGDIVQATFTNSGIASPAHWNSLPDEKREMLIAAHVSLLKVKPV